MTWGPAQAGVAKGIQECLIEGVLPPEAEDQWCVIAATWVNWSADNADEVFNNNYQAVKIAVANAMQNQPSLEKVTAASKDVFNPFYRPSN
jgi:5,6,7,8-tetrahydromethanopterin hydro-lyase